MRRLILIALLVLWASPAQAQLIQGVWDSGKNQPSIGTSSHDCFKYDVTRTTAAADDFSFFISASAASVCHYKDTIVAPTGTDAEVTVFACPNGLVSRVDCPISMKAFTAEACVTLLRGLYNVQVITPAAADDQAELCVRGVQ